MCGKRDESLLLDDLVHSVERLIAIRSEIPDGYLGADPDTTDRIQWNLTVLGEATKRLRPGTRDRFGDVPWTDFSRTRDRIVHHYEGIRWYLVAEIIDDELPPLLPRLIAIRDLLREEFDRAAP